MSMLLKRSRQAELEERLFQENEFVQPPVEKEDAPQTAMTHAVWEDEDAEDDPLIDLGAVDRLKKLRKDKDQVTLSEYSALLQNRFQSKPLAWTQVRSNADALVDDIAITATPLLSSSSKYLPPSVLSVKRMVDATIASPCSKAISGIHFHACGDVMVTSSLDKHIKLFKIDGDQNPLQLDVQFSDTPIYSSALLGASNELIVGGRKPHFHCYDLVTGVVKQYTGLHHNGRGVRSHENLCVSPEGTQVAVAGAGGYVHILSGRLKTETGQVKMNSLAKALCFHDEHTLVTAGVDADVYVWDLRKSARCIERFHNEDGMCCSSLASGTSGASSFLAAGSESGVATIYKSQLSKGSFQAQRLKAVMNITTTLTSMAFHPSAQLLAIASNQGKDSLKMVHLPSCTVYSNWPTDKTPLKTVTSLAFNGGKRDQLAIGNSKGRVLLYQLDYFAEQEQEERGI